MARHSHAELGCPLDGSDRVAIQRLPLEESWISPSSSRLVDVVHIHPRLVQDTRFGSGWQDRSQCNRKSQEVAGPRRQFEVGDPRTGLEKVLHQIAWQVILETEWVMRYKAGGCRRQRAVEC